jgi:hypothetical protein
MATRLFDHAQLLRVGIPRPRHLDDFAAVAGGHAQDLGVGKPRLEFQKILGLVIARAPHHFIGSECDLRAIRQKGLVCDTAGGRGEGKATSPLPSKICYFKRRMTLFVSITSIKIVGKEWLVTMCAP